MTYLLIFWEFFKTGLFAVGGGLATLPFLTQMSQTHPDWFTTEMLTDMIAVSESTPGPIGVNMATYVGFTVAGVPGAIIATCSLVLPSLIIITIIAGMLEKYTNNKYVQWVFSGLRPAVTGLIAAAGYSVIKLSIMVPDAVFNWKAPWAIFDWKCVLIFAVFVVLTQLKWTKKLHPIIFIAAAAVLGIVLGL
ncbi:MAG: chromate transporter [Clostridia bacterium]|nr:chromate transporter [Clostridia bacterium]